MVSWGVWSYIHSGVENTVKSYQFRWYTYWIINSINISPIDSFYNLISTILLWYRGSLQTEHLQYLRQLPSTLLIIRHFIRAVFSSPIGIRPVKSRSLSKTHRKQEVEHQIKEVKPFHHYLMTVLIFLLQLTFKNCITYAFLVGKHFGGCQDVGIDEGLINSQECLVPICSNPGGSSSIPGPYTSYNTYNY